ncbi:MAG TPA: ParB/RepB/Spo0J family partition protein [Dehalococcoidia bacterium]|nr:ParB/RepB/Spo0J family partition protein [Dehalococcoidia bacterium]
MPEIELKNIKPSRLNPRLELTKTSLDELSDSMKQVGIIEPIIVRPSSGESYEIVVGERRYRAAQQTGLDKIPAIIKDYSDEEVMEINLIENIQREELTAVEKGKICNDLLSKFPDRYQNRASLAKHLGVSESSVRSWLYTTEMPPEVQRRIAPKTEHGSVPAGKVDYRTAVKISHRIKEPNKFVEVIQHIADNKIPRRIATHATQQILREPDKPVKEIFREAIEETPIFLPFSRIHAEAITKGKKTQTARKYKDPRLQPGAVVRAQVNHYSDIKIKNVLRKKLCDLTEEDAKREGGYTLEEFKQVWGKLHGNWNPEEYVYVIQFDFLKEA